MRTTVHMDKERVIEEGPYSKYQNVGGDNYALLKMEPDYNDNGGGLFTLILPGTKVVKGSTLSDIHYSLTDMNSSDGEQYKSYGLYSMSHDNYEQSVDFILDLISTHSEDATALDVAEEFATFNL